MSGSPAGRASPARWAAVILPAIALALYTPPGVPRRSWLLLAVFVATILGLMLRPLPGGAIVLLGVSALALFGIMPITEALSGYADPVVWLPVAAFFLARAMLKTGLGRRIAFLFIRLIGHSSLGLGYALVSTDLVLALVIPSNGARTGGIVFPIATSLAEAYDSRPGPTARRLGAFLMTLVYQCEVIVCAMFLTGQASNVLIAKFALDTAGLELSYTRWLIGAVVPGLVALAVVGLIIYRAFPPEITHTPAARDLASRELAAMGPMSRAEKTMLVVFLGVAGLWMTMGLHGIHYTAIALLAICGLLLTDVLTWDDIISERSAWDIFVWYGGLVMMAGALSRSGLTRTFAELAAGMTVGWVWFTALGVLLLVYFYAHYAFASITAHATAMYIPFLVVILAAGAPPWVAVLSLAYYSNLCAGITHYGTTPGPILFGAGYVSQGMWWKLGLMASVPNILLFGLLGGLWWKLLGWW